MSEMLPLELQVEDNPIIKVIGVGGGGCNAVNYMYRKQDIKDVSFLVCNTDKMALGQMNVPAKLQLGTGLGAGGKPVVAAEYAESSLEKINEALEDGTKMVFITAGMGGGTGTGASPIVAREAQKRGILTVGIVTIPFFFEGKKAIRKALRGVANLAQYTDALLIINNEKLKLLYSDLDLPNAFEKADMVLWSAAKSISEIITVPGYINIDFQDVYNTLKNGDVAIMNEGMAEGENRITKAIENALASPLINNRDVHGAGRILMNFYCSKEHAILMSELDQVNEFCESMGDDVDVRWGASYDDSLGESVRVTIIATGYQVHDIPGMEDAINAADEEIKEPVKNEPKKTVDDVMEEFYPPQTTSNDEVTQSEEVVPKNIEDTNTEVITTQNQLSEADSNSITQEDNLEGGTFGDDDTNDDLGEDDTEFEIKIGGDEYDEPIDLTTTSVSRPQPRPQNTNSQGSSLPTRKVSVNVDDIQIEETNTPKKESFIRNPFLRRK